MSYSVDQSRMERLNILAAGRGFCVRTDPRLGWREFYLPEGTYVNREGKPVHPLYIGGPVFRINHPVSVSEIPVPEGFWVSYDKGDVDYNFGKFSKKGKPMDEDARNIVRALML